MEIQGFRIANVIHSSSLYVNCRAVRTADGVPVIIKTLKQEHPSPRQIARLEHEYLITKKLSHAGVRKIYSLEFFNESVALIQEDTKSESLHYYLEDQKPISLSSFFKISIQLSEILGSIHKQQVIHKDIRPSNVLWNPILNEVKLIDFGISTELSQENQELNFSNIIEGALPYISPEQTGRMNRQLDYRTDYYSLGVTYYELLTGTLPFQAEDIMGSVHNHIAKTPPDPTLLNPVIPHSLVGILYKLMAKDPDDRYQGIHGLIKDLQQCQKQWNGDSSDDEFVLGRWDISEQFNIPKKLLDREKELKSLKEQFSQVAKGYTGFTIISGPSGIGKTSLVKESSKYFRQKRSIYIEGKLDRFQQDTPYDAISKVLDDLVNQLLAESSDKIQQWRNKILKALGPNSQLILTLGPKLEKIIGPQPPPQELNPQEAQYRLLFTFFKFIDVFAQEEHPLVIFLDDFQWCDLSTQNLIQSLASSRQYQYILFILAISNDNTDEVKLMLKPIETIEKTNRIINHFHLSSLTESSVNNVTAGALQRSPDDCSELTKLVYQKTKGNPFYVIELLKDLYQSGAINFLNEDGIWDWDMDRVRQTAVCTNVVDLMIKELNQLNPDTLHFLTLAACIGNTFDLQTLSVLTGRSRIDINKILWNAVKKQIIIPLSDNYQLISADNKERSPITTKNEEILKVIYRFQDDQVQQSLYADIEAIKKEEIHLAIGQFLLKSTKGNDKDEKFSQVVKHLNKGRSLIQGEQEKENLARINLKAAKLAREVSAYSAALQYIEIAKNALPDDAWKKCYELILAIQTEYVQNNYLCGKFDTAGRHIISMLPHTKTGLDKIELFLMQSVQFAVTGNCEGAIKVGLKSLSILGVRISQRPNFGLILKEFLKVQWNLRGRKISSLVDAPELKDPNKKLIARILTELCGPVYTVGDDHLLALIILKLVNLSLRHGNSPETAFAYTLFGSFLIGVFGDFKRGNEFGKVGMALIENFQDLLLKCRCIYIHTVFNLHWSQHPSQLTPILLEGIEAGFQSGDLYYLGYLSQHAIIWDPKLSVKQILEELKEKYLPLAETTKNQNSIDMVKILRQLYSNFSGLTDETFSLNGPTFQEVPFLADIKQKDARLMLAFYYGAKAEIFFLLEDYLSTIDCIEEIDKVITRMTITPYRVRFSIMAFFSFSAQYTMMKSVQQKVALKRMKTEFSKMKKWAKNTPDNFLHLKLAMQGEMARVSGNYKKAAHCFEKATQKAGENGFIRDNAQINELAARFYLEEEQDTIAEIYLKKAYHLFNQWGASAKLRQLEQKYPCFKYKTTLSDRTLRRIYPKRQTADNSSRSGLDDELDTRKSIVTNLDLNSILKASQTLSSEIILPELLKKIMKIVVENAGAQNGILLLEREGQFFIEAATAIDSEGIVDLQTKPIEKFDRSDNLLPSSVVHYVIHTKEALILNDPKNDSTFSNSLYIIQKLPKSIICLPLLHQNKLIGLFYLENNLISGAFTPERVEILQHLCSYAAISIENARLYSLLGASEKKYRNIVEHAKEGIFQTSLDGKIITCNKAMAETFGYSSPDELKKSIVHLENDFFVDASKHKKMIKLLFKSGQIENFEYDTYKKDGTVIHASANARLVHDSNGKVKFIEGIISDITQKKQFENMEIARKKADAENTAKSDFLANMSHEIRTPMNTILGISDLLGETSLNNKQKSFVQMLKASGESLFELINDILDFSKIESGQIALESIAYSLDEQLETISKILISRAEVKGLQFSLHLDSNISPHRIGDPMRLRQILVNLIGNSIKFTEKGYVKVEVKRDSSSNDPNMIHFSVEDTGIGISDEQQQIIFDSFSQADAATTRSYGGSGLGLTISKKLVELLGGKIWIESELGKGAQFHFKIRSPEVATFPFVENVHDENFRELKVLLVESNQTARFVYQTFLEQYGIEIKAGDNKQFILGTLSRAEKRGAPIHIVLLDLDSDKYNGNEIIKQIKHLNLQAPPSLLPLYTKLDQHSKLEFEKLNLHHTIQKPLKDGKLLIEKIQSLLSKNPVTVSSSRNPEEKLSSQTEPVKVLLAEDIESNWKIIELYFEEVNIQLDLAIDGEKAVKMFVTGSYDIVFMDVQMPVMNGIEATRSIRKWESERGKKQTPIIVLTAHAVKHQQQKCLEAGCSDFLSKPILKKDLMGVLDSLFSTRLKYTPNTIKEKKQTPKPIFPTQGTKHTVLIDFSFKDLVPYFIDEIKLELKKLKTAQEKGDYNTLQRLGHGLKGAAMNYRFNELSLLFGQLEKAAVKAESVVVTTSLEQISDYIQSVEVVYSNG